MKITGEALFRIDDLLRTAQARKPVGLTPEEVDEFCFKHGSRAAYRLGYQLATAIERQSISGKEGKS